MKLYPIFTFTLILLTLSGFSQFDSTKVFKKSKGTLPHPIPQHSQYKIDSPNHENPCECMIFICYSAYPVNAIHDGVAVEVQQIEDIFVIIIKYGDYFISYSGLSNPMLSKGDFVKAGQIISSLAKSYDHHYELTLYISNRGKNFNPSEWLAP